MIEISLFGVLAGTLVSGLSLVFLLVALGAAAYLGGVTLTATLRLGAGRGAASSGAGTALRRAGVRWSPRAGAGAALVSLAFAAAGLRFHDAGSAAGTFLFTAAVALTAATATGAWSAALALSGCRALASLADRRAERRARLDGARHAAVRALEAKSALFLSGDDLRGEVAQAEAALAQLGGALAQLEGIGAGLRAKLASAAGGKGADDEAKDSGKEGDGEEGDGDSERAPGDSGSASSHLVAEHAEIEGDVARKVELGRKIQAEAEIAVFRLRCREPLRRLVRRRPREATSDLGAAAASREELRAAVTEALPAVERFLAEARETQRELSGLADRRPTHLDAADPDDPLARAEREVAAIEAAYAAVLRRVEVVVLRLDADAGLREVANAAGSLSPSARLAGLDEAELDQLISEVSRADAALSIGLPGDLEARSVSEALARGAEALVRNDGRSLDDLLRTMKEIE